jgi:hypothetical protein
MPFCSITKLSTLLYHEEFMFNSKGTVSRQGNDGYKITPSKSKVLS